MLRNRSQVSSSNSQSSTGHNNNNDDTDGHDEDTVFGDDDLREKKSSKKSGVAGAAAAPFKPIINFVKERRAINSTKAVLSVLLLMVAAVASMGFSWLVEREERLEFENEVRCFK